MKQFTATPTNNDDSSDLDPTVKIIIWVVSYLVIIVVMIVQYFRYRREQQQMKAELGNFEEVEGPDHSFLEASRFD